MVVMNIQLIRTYERDRHNNTQRGTHNTTPTPPNPAIPIRGDKVTHCLMDDVTDNLTNTYLSCLQEFGDLVHPDQKPLVNF